MSFLNPTLAWAGLLCVMIPIIIHLLMRRRRRPVPWAAMRFIIEAYRRQRRRMNLEQFLLLAARCLLVALLALAVGKPVLGRAGAIGSRGPRTLHLLVDNSLPAATTPVERQQSDLALLKEAALAAIDELDTARGDRVSIIAVGGPAEAVVMPPSPELAAARQIVKDLPQTHAKADWTEAMRLVRDAIAKPEAVESEQVVAAVSSWRAGSFDAEVALAPLSVAAAAAPLVIATPPSVQQVDNVGIVAVEPARAVMMASGSGGGTEAGGMPVRVLLRRSGPGTVSPATTMLSVRAVPASGQGVAGEESRQVVPWNAGQDEAQVFVTMSPPPSDRSTTQERPGVFVVASIDADALAPDNRSIAALQVRDRLEVALVVPPGGAASLAGGADLAAYEPQDWIALSLSPRGDFSLRRRQSGELRVQVVDPQQGIAPGVKAGGTGRGAGVLAGMDAVILPRPDLLEPIAWRAVREALDAGALVVITPSNGEATQVWTQEVRTALGVDWSIARDVTTLDAPSTLAPGLAAAGLLEQIAAELPELVRSVTVSRLLEVRAGADGMDTLLATADGRPVAVSTIAGASESGSSRRGTLVLFASAIDLAWTDLPARPLMVPLMQEVVRQGISRGVGLPAMVAGTPLSGLMPPDAADLEWVSAASADRDGPRVVGIAARGAMQTPLRTGGGWIIRSSSGVTLGSLAVNADAGASAVAIRTRDQVAKWLEGCSPRLAWASWGQANEGGGSAAGGAIAGASSADRVPPVSLPLLIAAGIVGLLELAFARWFSHANRDAFGSRSGTAKGATSA